jgi:hypothetical protein
MDEYRKIEQTFSPTALKEISNWILKRIWINPKNSVETKY